jgi:FXSXX-COOH protein
MVDLSESSLAELVEHDDSALARALRRLADDLTRPGEPIAGFNSAV